ncbi:right-handed parallel beta-helix repeat-containing protein [Chitinispirillales bacterium ANBcel5]|uniref:right-handed parallel beta-helix repeat-containing protein n=1 Tax=Cellulosispirillum alkaliphilum TaxID=3039283 RepID=UPI002A561F2E|nr:right-handed parallel beta-helix repeat-containing protein [Chitinispirillales bacterium ANBcel5]
MLKCKKKLVCLIIALCSGIATFSNIPDGDRTFFIATDGDDSNSGTKNSPLGTLDHAVGIAEPGDVFVLRGGTYYHDRRIDANSSGTQEKPITIVNYPEETPVLNFEAQEEQPGRDGLRINGDHWHVIGIHLTRAGGNGFRIHGSHNFIKQCVAFENRLTGIHLEDGSHNLIKNNDSYRNFNLRGRVGNMSDGFAAKYEALGPGNVFYGNRAWENSDDGFDFWMAESTILLENNWAFGNGNSSIWNHPEFDGGGNGFKLGGNHISGNHIIKRNMAFDNHGKGFDHNNNTGALYLAHNSAYNNGITHNGRNFDFPNEPSSGQHQFYNNLSYNSPNGVRIASGSDQQGNSWQQSESITDDMFLSLLTSAAKGPRQPDGSLPDILLLRPRPETFMVNGGVDIDEPYSGTAPDIGAYEHGESGDAGNTKLQSLMIDGEALPSFNPSTLSYTLTLAAGTSVPPIISADPEDDSASVEIVQPRNITGDNFAPLFSDALIKVIAGDNQTHRTYTVSIYSPSSWNGYNWTAMPDNSSPPFSQSNWNQANYSLIEDPDNPGNSFLQLITNNASNKGEWVHQISSSADEFTVIAKIRALPGDYLKAMVIDLRLFGVRERLYINSDNSYHLRHGGSQVNSLPQGSDVMNWNIYRLTREGNETRFFFNENPVPLEVTHSETVTDDNHFGFGDPFSDQKCAGQMDWLLWSDQGAFYPEQSTAQLSFSHSQNSAFEMTVHAVSPKTPFVTIEYVLDKDQPTVLNLYDIKGRVVRRVLNDIKNKGIHLQAVNISSLANGTYFLRLATLVRAVQRRIVIAR